MYDVIIIGGGAAGMTAALYTLRAGKTVLLIEKEAIGGQVAISPRVENFPSIKEIAGSEFADNMFDQIMSLGTDFELDDIKNVTKNGDIFTLTGDFGTYEGKSVILATGVKHRKINVSGEDELIGKGVSYCAVCDGAFYKDEDVCLIGDANTALQYALLLSNYCKSVQICTLFDHFFGDDILVNRIKERENIKYTHNLALQEFKTENDELSGLVFKDTKTNELKEYKVKGCFIAIGQIPDNKRFENLVELDKFGYIITNEDMETKTPGVFACGDCRNKKVRQLTTAVSDGAIASVGAVAFIDK